MTAKELIAELQKLDPEVKVSVAVYGCGGFDDLHGVDDVEQREYDGSKWIQIGISVGCDVHKGAFINKCSQAV